METNEAGMGRLSAKNLFAWALAMVKSPARYFGSLQKDGGYAAPALYAMFWFLVSALLELLLSFVRPHPLGFSLTRRAVWVFAGPPIIVGFGFLLTAQIFVLWHLMGSKNDYRAAFRCWASLAPLSAAGVVLGLVPYLNLTVLAYGLYLIVAATVHAHLIQRARAWIVWGGVTFLVLALGAGSIMAQKRLRRSGFNRYGAPPAFGGRRPARGLPGMSQNFPSNPADLEAMIKQAQSGRRPGGAPQGAPSAQAPEPAAGVAAVQTPQAAPAAAARPPSPRPAGRRYPARRSKKPS